jgi:hypothetical protein
VPRLRRSSCAAPGISRRRRGRGFEYLDSEGERIDLNYPGQGGTLVTLHMKPTATEDYNRAVDRLKSGAVSAPPYNPPAPGSEASGQGRAVTPRMCGDIPASTQHNTISGVTAQGVGCEEARRVAVDAFSHSQASVDGYRCRTATNYELSTTECSQGQKKVSFTAGV